jgi:hypothetical protein
MQSLPPRLCLGRYGGGDALRLAPIAYSDNVSHGNARQQKKKTPPLSICTIHRVDAVWQMAASGCSGCSPCSTGTRAAIAVVSIAIVQLIAILDLRSRSRES